MGESVRAIVGADSDAPGGYPHQPSRIAVQKRGGAVGDRTIMTVAEAYFDLQQAAGGLAIAREAAANAEALAYIADSYAVTGQGLEADPRRAQAELQRRRQEIPRATSQLKVASAEQMAEAAKAVVRAVESLKRNFANIRQGPLLKSETRPIEVLQPIQALDDARVEYLGAVIAYNRALFRLYRALGHCPKLDARP